LWSLLIVAALSYMVTMYKNKMTKDKAPIRKGIPLVSIALAAFFIFFAGCLDNEPENEEATVDLTPDAVLELSRETYGTSDGIEFGVRNTGNTNLLLGRTFDLEFYNQSSKKWEPVEMDMEVTLELIILAPGDAFSQKFVPKETFVNEVEEGQYRIRKSVSIEDTEESMELEKTFRIEAGNE
jgi:hypothetical protein